LESIDSYTFPFKKLVSFLVIILQIQKSTWAFYFAWLISLDRHRANGKARNPTAFLAGYAGYYIGSYIVTDE